MKGIRIHIYFSLHLFCQIFVYYFFTNFHSLHAAHAEKDANLNAHDNAVKIHWPVSTEKKFQISSTFAESRIDHFHNGLDIPGENVTVKPVAKGRVIWQSEGNDRPGELPFGGGKTVIISHNTFWSGYMHLKSFRHNLAKESEITTDQSIGLSGNTGHSGGAHLHFFLFEPGNRKMYNPLLLLDHSFYTDIKPPEIQEIAVALPDKLAVVNPERPILMSGDYTLGVRITDRGKGKERWGIYKFSVRFKNSLVKSAVFDSLLFLNDRWQTSNGLVFEDIYLQGYYNIGKKIRENKEITVSASDLKEQSVTREYSLEIVEK